MGLDFDVIIAGAGPAGTAAGFDLVSAGMSVLIMDRRDFPRKKACAGGITPKAMGLFPYDISHLIVRTCRKIVFRPPGGRAFPITAGGSPLCYMTQRQDLDAYALDRLTAAGGRFLKIEKIISLDQDNRGVGGQVICGGRRRRFRARYLIGADGANSRVRELLGRSLGNIARYPALEADVRVDRPGAFAPEFDFSRGIAGYYWIFPKGDHVNIGIYGASPNVSVNRRLLVDYARERLGSETLENIKGYPIAVGGGRACAGIKRILLAGDAAGLAEPLFGEGIYFALKSGKTAAAAIVRSKEGRAGSGYRRRLSRLFMDLYLHRLGAALLYRFPGTCLGIGGYPPVKAYFAKGVARGRTISQLLTPHSF
ncbi:MAG: geranylgeranyl reductase family protein [Desulfobacter sp.]|nr:MAG: geranylgeranyl reductase family protein [Desulfobacter sp.]